MALCILYQNAEATVTLLDIPCSLELAQGDSNATRRIISTKPLEHPYPSVEPKSAKARAKLGDIPIGDLLLQRHVQIALDGIREVYRGNWCLPRETENLDGTKRKRADELSDEFKKPEVNKGHQRDAHTTGPQCLYRNPKAVLASSTASSPIPHVRLPPNSVALCGEIEDTLQTLASCAPKFNLIIMDPPWPNRSARRKNSYEISYSTSDIRNLLSSIPINDHLTEDGFVAVWVTNKLAFREMLLQEEGLFDEWSVDLVEEWIWIKTTINGEPICALDSVWRKPYEILLVGRKKDGKRVDKLDVKRRVIAGVPDLHSRKPNLKFLFQELIGREEYNGLEIFARSQTAGWWAWGNEAVKFQALEYWIEEISS